MRESKTWVEVSSKALRHNVRQIKRLASPAACMAVVKSNAYGHGLLETARAVADDVDAFAVDSADEGMALRAAGIRKPVVVLGYTRHGRMADAMRHDLSLTVSDELSVRCAARVACARYPARLHLKMETGLYRQGANEQDLPRILNVIKRARFVVLEGLSTHYANIEDTRDDAYAKKQLTRFIRVREAVRAHGFEPRWCHTACSAAAILYPQTHFNMVRLGVALYGLWPSHVTLVSARALGRQLDLRPALTWKTIVAQVKRVPRGESVGYGLTEQMKRETMIVVLPIGYWDGYDRGFSRQSEVLIRGRRCRILGRIFMNMCVADVTELPHVRVEDGVVLLGRQKNETVTAEELAEKIDTINYEIVTRINPMIPRITIK